MRRAVIIGGSMAGLLAGHYLARTGWQVDIYERTPGALTGRGAGIVSHPELLSAFADIGIATGDDFGVAVRRRLAIDAANRVIASIPRLQTTVSWTKVHEMLRTHFPSAQYHAGAEFTGFEERDGKVVVAFADGHRETCDLLVGADGVRSSVRRLLYPDLQPLYAGYCGWRGLMAEHDLGDLPDGAAIDDYMVCLPPGEHMLGYLVAGPGGETRAGKRSYNFVWYRPVAVGAELTQLLTGIDGRRHEGAIPPNEIRPDVIADMRNAARRLLAPWFQRVVDRVPQPFLQPIFDLTTPSMVRGPVALVGDAAFVVRPHVGAGVTKAADDARVLAECLRDPTAEIGTALAAFSKVRTKAGNLLVERARQLGSYLRYDYDTPEQRAAAMLHAAPLTVLTETARLDFLREAMAE